MNRRHLPTVLCALLLALMLLLTACGAQQTAKPQESSAGFAPRLDPQTEGSVTVVGHYNNFEALEAEFVRFAEYYPQVTLTYTYLDGYSKILSTALVSGEAPDIFFTYPWMGDWEDGADIFAASEDLSDPALGIDLSCVRSNLLKEDAQGQILSVPVYTTTYGMLVNEDLFAKENIAIPQTYSELLSACEAFKKAGYANPILGYNKSGELLYPLYYPFFCAGVQGNEAALNELNALKPEAGEYLRGMLELTADFTSRGYLDLESCSALENNYEAVILRFFEGDVPMMICAGDTVSGTKKRESQSEAFTKSPFNYTFQPIPMTDEGGYFIDSPSVEFSVNKDCDDLDMTNEFMRFLITNKELNAMASVKRLVTPTSDLTLDSVYAPFGKVPSERVISPEVLGVLDPLTVQIREAAFRVGKGEITVDEAIAMYGTFK